MLIAEINVDFAEVYGADFNFLNELKPASIILADGSEADVFTKVKN